MPGAIKTGGEFFVGDSSQDPSVAVLPGGRFVAVWSHSGEITARLFNADGTPSGGEIPVNTITDGFQGSPVVAALPDGRFMVAWDDDSETTGSLSGTDVRTQIFDVNGNRIGSEILVNTSIDAEDEDPAIAVLADGRFVVTWQTLSDIDAQIINADGTKSGAEINVETTFREDQNEATIAAFADGRFVVAWTDDADGSEDGSGSEVRAQTFNPDGSKFGVEFIVNTATANDQNDASVAVLSDGRFVIAWEDFSQTGGDTSNDAVRAQIFNSDGSRFGGEFLVNTTTEFQQGNPVVAALANGRFVIAWEGFGSIGTNLFAQVFNADGTKSGGEIVINALVGRQDELTLTVLDNDRFVVTWRDWEDGNDIKGQIFDAHEGAGVIGSASNDGLVGTDGADVLFGLGGADVIDGGNGDDILHGGAGSDSLTGGAGKDQFVFDGPLNPAINLDFITDFSKKGDTIALDNAVFTALKKDGKLKDKYFEVGKKADDKDDYILYNKKTGALSYDADGSKKGSAAIAFAQLDDHLKMKADDFLVI